MAAASGSTQTLVVLDGNGTQRSLAEVFDPGNASARVTVAVSIPHWSVTNTSSAAALGTASIAAGAAGVKHVCTGFTAQLRGDATGNADQGTLNIRDGATTAGTVLWTGGCTLAAGALAQGTPFSVTNLNLVGTAATAMTVEFSAAGATHTIQVVNMQGYDIS